MTGQKSCCKLLAAAAVAVVYVRTSGSHDSLSITYPGTDKLNASPDSSKSFRRE